MSATVNNLGDFPVGVAISPDGSVAVVADFSYGTVSLIDTATNTVIGEPISPTAQPSGIAISPDGTSVYLAAGGDDAIAVVTLPAASSLAPPPASPAALVAGTSASATAVGTGATVGGGNSSLGSVTRTFEVVNLTQYSVTLNSYGAPTNADDIAGPPLTSVLAPGGVHTFELTFYFFKDNTWTPTSSNPVGGVYAAQMNVAPVFGFTDERCFSSGGARCDPDYIRTSNTNTTFLLLDKPGTVVTVPAGEGAEQTNYLNHLCADNSRATCPFVAKSQISTHTDDHPVGNAFANNTDETVRTEISITDTQSNTDSVEVSAKTSFSIAKIVDVEISAKYGHKWTNTHTFTQKLNVEILPHKATAVTAQQPVYRVTGDFTIEMGNTTLKLTDIYLDSPNNDGQGVYNVHYVDVPPDSVL